MRDPFDAHEADRRAMLAEAERRNSEQLEVDARAAEQRRAGSTAFSLETNERLRIAEFRFHGVEPPLIDGAPTRSSFHLLRTLGWTVEEVFGGKQLVAPQARPETTPRKSRQDYDQNT